jgi:metal-responsive CopG/Arc/MetJ family transcriptional regulator
MLSIPDEILRSFDALMEKKSVSQRLRPDYRKWLRYFLDFRAKYQPPDSRSEQVRQFIDKLRSKSQSPQQLNEAAEAVSLGAGRACAHTSITPPPTTVSPS